MTHAKNDSDFRFDLLSACTEEEHFHLQTELLYVPHGTATVKVEGESRLLSAEDLLLVNPNRRHSLSVPGEALVCRLHISYGMLKHTLNREHVLFWCDSAAGQNEYFLNLRVSLRQMLGAMLSQSERPNLMLYSYFYELLHCLTEHFLVESGDARFQQEGGSFDERMIQIVNYIEEHYAEHITLNDLADRLHLTYSYLSRYFKKTFGINFLEYLNNTRLRHAVEDLLYTEQPITRIAVDNGYVNASTLNRAFKDTYHMSPTAYKKQMNRSPDASDAPNRIAVQKAMYQRARDYLSENGVEERQSVRVQSCTVHADGAKKMPYEKNWQELINIGRASDLLKSKVQEQVIFLRDTLGFHGVRFWGIFDTEMELRPGHETEALNFDRLDEVLDFLVYNNLTPFIELGDKPVLIANNTRDVILHSPGEPVFLVLTEYRAVLEQFFHHLITRYRSEQVRRWRFECWDDLRTARQAEPVSYFDIFNLTCETIRSILPDAVIGGCGMKVNDDEMESFLRRWQQQPCQPDFFSVYSYPYEVGQTVCAFNGTDYYTVQSNDSQFLRRHVERTRFLLQTVGMDIPLYVTEWNCTISSRNFLNDTCWKGAYVLKNVVENLGKADVLAYWAGSDLVGTYYDSRNILNGCPGLLTKDSICKSAYYAFRFLGRMGPWLVEAGENYLITTSGHFSYYIVCWNYHPLNYRYYRKQEHEHTVKDILALSQNNASIRMSFQLDNLPDDRYSIKTSVVSPHSGSVLDEWVRLNTMTNVRKEDINYLKRICTPYMSIREMDVRAGQLRFELELEAEQISLIHIYHK